LGQGEAQHPIEWANRGEERGAKERGNAYLLKVLCGHIYFPIPSHIPVYFILGELGVGKYMATYLLSQLFIGLDLHYPPTFSRLLFVFRREWEGGS